MLPRTSGKGVVPSLLDHPCSHSKFVSDLYTALPLYPFSSPSTSLQLCSSANFRECWQLVVQCCSPKSQSQPVFLTYSSGCLVASSTLCIQAIPVPYMPFLYSSYKQPPLHHPLVSHLSSSFPCTPLSSSPDICSLMSTMEFPFPVVSGHLFPSVNLPAPPCSSVAPSSAGPTPK